jgi:hypothetical protein
MCLRKNEDEVLVPGWVDVEIGAVGREPEIGFELSEAELFSEGLLPFARAICKARP